MVKRNCCRKNWRKWIVDIAVITKDKTAKDFIAFFWKKKISVESLLFVSIHTVQWDIFTIDKNQNVQSKTGNIVKSCVLYVQNFWFLLCNKLTNTHQLNIYFLFYRVLLFTDMFRSLLAAIIMLWPSSGCHTKTQKCESK